MGVISWIRENGLAGVLVGFGLSAILLIYYMDMRAEFRDMRGEIRENRASIDRVETKVDRLLGFFDYQSQNKLPQ